MVTFETRVYIVEDYREFGETWDDPKQILESYKTKDDFFDFLVESAKERFEKDYPNIEYEVDEERIQQMVDDFWEEHSPKKK